MRFALVLSAIFFGATTSFADDLPSATRVIEREKTTFPIDSLTQGLKVTLAVVESCHSLNDGRVNPTIDDVKKARKGDHVRFVFARPRTIKVLGQNLKASEVIYADGVFWLRNGDQVFRCAKYEPDKWDRFLEWSRQTLPADGPGKSCST